MSQTIGWDVRTDGRTVIVELPNGLDLDRETSEAINDAFFDAIEGAGVDSVLTLLAIDDPLGRGVFDEVKKGADRAAANDVNRWAIVVQEKVKGMAFESRIDGLETAVFDDESEARAWLRDQ